MTFATFSYIIASSNSFLNTPTVTQSIRHWPITYHQPNHQSNAENISCICQCNASNPCAFLLCTQFERLPSQLPFVPVNIRHSLPKHRQQPFLTDPLPFTLPSTFQFTAFIPPETIISTSSNTQKSPIPVAKMKDLALPSKISIVIAILDDQKDDYLPSYTTWDEINGRVSITAPNDTSFDQIFIIFDGSTHTFVEKATSSTSTMAARRDVRTSPAHYTFVQANREPPRPRDIVSGLPCSPSSLKHSADLEKYNRSFIPSSV